MSASDDTYSPGSWWSESGNADATSEYTADSVDLSGYSAGTPVPGTESDPPGAKTDFPANALNDQTTAAAEYKGDDQLSTIPDSSSISGAQQGLGAMSTGAVGSLRQAVDDTPTRTVPGVGSGGAAQAAGGASSGLSPALINTWQPVGSGGYLAADLVYTDASLIGALQAAGAGAGGQAALMAQTVTLDGNTVTAGGPTPVGTRRAPAAALAAGSEYNTAPQFSCGPWFYPAVAAWAESHPPPPPPRPA